MNKLTSINKIYDMIKDTYRAPSAEVYEHYNVKRGLRNSDGTGVMAGLTSVGDVHGYVVEDGDRIPREGKLRYRGIDVRDIVAGCQAENRFGYEEVSFLLLTGVLPNKEQLEEYIVLLGELRELPDGFAENMIMKAPSNNIMNKLARSILANYSYDQNPDDTSLPNVLRQSAELIARVPTMVAYGYNAKRHYHDGKSLFIHKPKKELSTAENFLHLIRPDNKFTNLEAELLDLSLILHAEHGGGNNSTFAARVVSSSDTDTYSAISAAVGSLKGPKHGGANERVISMIEDFKANVSDITNEEQVANHIIKIFRKQAFDRAGLVYGMGHAIYTLSDPRAELLKQKARVLAEEKGLMDEFKLHETIEKLTPSIFNKEKNCKKALCANVDLYSGFVYKMLDIPEDLYTALFAIARMSGWCAHRIEEITTGKRIIRPAYKTILPSRKYIFLSKR